MCGVELDYYNIAKVTGARGFMKFMKNNSL